MNSKVRIVNYAKIFVCNDLLLWCVVLCVLFYCSKCDFQIKTLREVQRQNKNFQMYVTEQKMLVQRKPHFWKAQTHKQMNRRVNRMEAQNQKVKQPYSRGKKVYNCKKKSYCCNVERERHVVKQFQLKCINCKCVFGCKMSFCKLERSL